MTGAFNPTLAGKRYCPDCEMPLEDELHAFYCKKQKAGDESESDPGDITDSGEEDKVSLDSKRCVIVFDAVCC